MKELILYKNELDILSDLENNLDNTEILKDLVDYGFIKWIWSDSNWYLEVWLTINWKQVLRQIENKSKLDDFEFELDFWIIKIRTK